MSSLTDKEDKILIPEPHLTQIKFFLENKLGLHYTTMREKELSRKLTDASEGFGYTSVLSFIVWLLNTDQSIANLEKLASYLTIGETYFLREKEAFHFLKYEYLTKLFNDDKREKTLSVWSAGCSSGEEVYSLAAMLCEMLPDIDEWDIKILGTDINPTSLQKAMRGVYTEWSFRKTEPWFKKKYVTKTENGKYRVIDKLRKFVEFRSHNLATNHSLIFKQDIIFCRNVLIYFDKPFIKKVTSHFYDSLKEGGVLILSPVEVGLNICERFIKKFYMGRTFFVKESISSELFIHKNVDYKIEPVRETQEGITVLERDSDESIDKEYERIHFLFKEGMYMRVENLIYKKSNDIIALPFDYQVLLARTFANRGKLNEAEDICDHLLMENGFNIDVKLLLVNIYMDQREMKKALKSLQDILKKKPRHLLSLYYMVIVEQKLGFKHSAMSHCMQAIELLENERIDEVIDIETGMTAGKLKLTLESFLNQGEL